MVGLVVVFAALSGLFAITSHAEEGLEGFGSAGHVAEPPPAARTREAPPPPPKRPIEWTRELTVTAPPDEPKPAQEPEAPVSVSKAETAPEPAAPVADPVQPRNSSGSSTRPSGQSAKKDTPPPPPPPPPETDDLPPPIRDLPNGWKEFAIQPGWVENAPDPGFPPPGEHGLEIISCTIERTQAGSAHEGIAVRVMVRNNSPAVKSGELGLIFGIAGHAELARGQKLMMTFPFNRKRTSGVIVNHVFGVSEEGNVLASLQLGVAAPVNIAGGETKEVTAEAYPSPSLFGHCGDNLYLELRHPAVTPITCGKTYRPQPRGGGCPIAKWDVAPGCKTPVKETPAFKRCKVDRTQRNPAVPPELQGYGPRVKVDDVPKAP